MPDLTPAPRLAPTQHDTAPEPFLHLGQGATPCCCTHLSRPHGGFCCCGGGDGRFPSLVAWGGREWGRNENAATSVGVQARG